MKSQNEKKIKMIKGYFFGTKLFPYPKIPVFIYKNKQMMKQLYPYTNKKITEVTIMIREYK